MGGTTGAGNDQAKASFLGGAGVRDEAEGSSVSADDASFGGNAGTAEKSLGGLKGGPVGSTTHDDADERAGAFQEVRLLPSGLK